MRLGEGRVGSSRPSSPPPHPSTALLGSSPCKPGTTNPRLLQAGLFGDPRGQGHELRVPGGVRRGGTLANLGEKLKILKHLQVLPLPSGNIREAKRGRKREGSEKAGEAEDYLSHHQPPCVQTGPTLPAPQASPFHCLHLGVLTLSNQAQPESSDGETKTRSGLGLPTTRPGPLLLICSAMGSKDPVGSPQTLALSPQARTASC